MATGTVSIAVQKLNSDAKNSRLISRYTVTWTSDASGDVNQSFVANGAGLVSGSIKRVVINPGATAPTALYDLTITDEQGVDVLAGQGANLSDTVTTEFSPGVALDDGTTTSVIPMVVDDILTFVVANAGNAKGGVVVLYME